MSTSYVLKTTGISSDVLWSLWKKRQPLPPFSCCPWTATWLLLCLLMGWLGKHPTELPDEY